jgi:hypothetical protein
MKVEERSEGQANPEANAQGITIPKLRPGAVDSYLALPRPDHNLTLEQSYKSITSHLPLKFALAEALISDGRYEDPVFLLHNFIPSRQVLSYIEDSEDRAAAEQEIKTTGRVLKDRLALMLLKKGILTNETEVRDAVTHSFEQNERVSDLALAGWPIEVVGQIMTLELFSDIDDTRKMEELRGWVTRALYRPYLGTLSGIIPEREMSIPDMLDRVPKQIYRNKYMIQHNLVERYLEQKFMQGITDTGLEQGLEGIEQLVDAATDPDERYFLERVQERFYDIATYPLQGDFRPDITVKDRQRQFPSFEQRAFSYDFLTSNTRLLTADTGLGKTGAAFLAMENTEAEKVLVLAPASGKQTWQLEADKIYYQPDQVLIVSGSQDILAAKSAAQKYVVVSQELLEDAEQNPKILEHLLELVRESGIDAAIIDEIDNLTNNETISVKTALKVLEGIRVNHHEKGRAGEAPVLGLTATPIKSSLADVNIPMAVLYPEKYAPTTDASTGEKKTFSDTYLNRPDLAYLALIGEKRMFRWEQATGVQEFSYDLLRFRASPFEEYLYSFVLDEVAGGSLDKFRLLENTLFNPLLIKAEVRLRAEDKIPAIDIDEVLNTLKDTLREWKVLQGIAQPQQDGDFLSADRLVELGLGDMVLGCFFAHFENGIDTLVEEFTRETDDPELQELREFWRNREISTKYRLLKEQLIDALTWRDSSDGVKQREKFIAVSPGKKQGRTDDVSQREITDKYGRKIPLHAAWELQQLNNTTLIKLMREWVASHGLGDPDKVPFIDGSITVGQARDGIINAYVNDITVPGMLVTLETMFQSRDLMLNVIKNEDEEIIGVRKIFTEPPWNFRDLRQMIGRSQRQGQRIPVRNVVLQAEGLIDEGKAEAVKYTYLLSRMALSGITLTDEEKEFFDSKRRGNKIELQSADARFMRDFFGRVRGAGEEKLEAYLDEPTLEGKTVAERFAAQFYGEGQDMFQLTGYNADMVSRLIHRSGKADGKILSLGAGTLLLQRTLERGIDNVDINPYMMEAAWPEAQSYGGKMILAAASRLPTDQIEDNTYDVVDSAFALHWSRLQGSKKGNVQQSERVRILTAVNDKLQDGGLFILTLPESVFDDDAFERFTEVLEGNFGFKVDTELSGWSFGLPRIGKEKRLGWCIVGYKKGEVNLSQLNLEQLAFLSDKREWVSKGKKKESRNGAVKKDYPEPEYAVRFKEYRIQNPLQRDHITQLNEETENGLTAMSMLIPERDIVEDGGEIFNHRLSFLRGATQADFKEYRRDFVRKMADITGWSWEEIEEFASGWLASQQGKPDRVKNRSSAYTRILKAAKEMLYNQSQNL